MSSYGSTKRPAVIAQPSPFWRRGEQALSLAQRLDREEASLRNLSFERAAVLTPAGQVLWRKDGTHSSIAFTEAEAESMRGNIVTHNHPSGRSFSDADVIVALSRGLAELRAVSRHYTYTLRPTSDAKKVPRETDQQYVERIALLYRQGDALVAYQMRPSLLAGTMSSAEADANHHHKVLLYLAPRLGFDYYREPYSLAEHRFG